ncbi:hypothetical protein [Neisseria gonorrhoeae]|uniref:hypothetical protein n=1 Tax=Neisseria gonorrhoeae TaxID=485 RepID=UPI0021A5131F|nr:hypothetical protein [Neisseria gonorrhoeae]UWT37926.1 hypothetical protein NDQ65_02405 [Neisseria gonorrhoeae]UYA80629.1 hypothetical protein LLE32_02420 [Neisseria gonorrhoeae]
MSYLEDVKNALRVIDNLCKEALKEPESLEGYIDKIRDKADEADTSLEFLKDVINYGISDLKNVIEVFEDCV